MMHPFLLLAAAAAPQSPGTTGETIVVTGSREPVTIEEAGVSATIISREQIEALALPGTSDVLRLLPGVSVANTGPRGTQTQLRIRGAEANHSLLFVDGIRFNDPAAGNEARFELLTNDALSQIEVVRGPQSALWGSEALGGVIALETANPLQASGLSALGEYGSLDSGRAAAQFSARAGALGLGGSVGWLKTGGIDSFGGGGDRDGYENRSASLKAAATPLPSMEIGVVGHWIVGESEFDRSNADTLDATENRIRAVRAWAGKGWDSWSLAVDASFLGSANRNRRGTAQLNRTFGKRLTVGGQLSRTLSGHRLTAAVEHEAEDFRARRQIVFGAPDQDRSRSFTAFIGQWRAEWSDRFVTDVAVRHDRFSAFANATTLRGIALFRPTAGWTLHAGYGEGIAQPTFFDLYGFFPATFVGNPALRPESARGWEAGVRWSGGAASVGVTGFSNRLKDEIVSTFDLVTFLSGTANAYGRSRRRGVEAEAQYRAGAFRLGANYTFLESDEPQAGGTAQVREIRRPKHSANLVATGSFGAATLGASLAYVGKRRDTDFNFFPGRPVALDDYLLGSLNLGYRLTSKLEAYARVENAFDADYQDVVGFNTPGRTVYAGLRLRLGD